MNAQRSGHRGPPPRHPVTGSLRAMCSEGRPADGGWVGPWLFFAHWCGGFRMNAQRADTEVRPPATLDLVPGGRCDRRGAQRRWGLPDPGWCSARRCGCFRMNADGSGHRGPPPRRPGSGPWRMVCSEGCPAEMGAGPVHGSAVVWVSRPVRVAVVPRGSLSFPPLESQGLGGVWCSSPEQRLWSVLSFS